MRNSLFLDRVLYTQMSYTSYTLQCIQNIKQTQRNVLCQTVSNSPMQNFQMHYFRRGTAE